MIANALVDSGVATSLIFPPSQGNRQKDDTSDSNPHIAYACTACLGGKYKPSVGWSESDGCLPCNVGEQAKWEMLPCVDGLPGE